MNVQYFKIRVREFIFSDSITIRLPLDVNGSNTGNEFYRLPLSPSYEKDIKDFVWLGVDIDLLKCDIHKLADGSVELQTVVPKLTELQEPKAHYIDGNGIPYKEITINQESIKEIVINKEFLTENKISEFEKYHYKRDIYGSYNVFKLSNENA